MHNKKRIVLLSLIITFICFSNIYSQIKIGVALPLMKSSQNEDDKVLGEQMLSGIVKALEE